MKICMSVVVVLMYVYKDLYAKEATKTVYLKNFWRYLFVFRFLQITIIIAAAAPCSELIFEMIINTWALFWIQAQPVFDYANP